MRDLIKTTTIQIINYWVKEVDESDLSIDFSEAHERCWRCGYKTVLHRCHIIPDSLGGKDSPNNLVLLCNRCHREAPNIDDFNFFWDWLKAQKESTYDTYWTIRGLNEYEDVYKENVESIFIELGVKPDEFTNYLNNQGKFVTIHFGEGRLNPSTIAGIFHRFIELKRQEFNQ